MWLTGMTEFLCLSVTHEHNFYRDISILNALMDGSMYPDGWHPCNRRRMRDNFRLLAKHFSRTERPPKYYFIDFGISRRYGPEDKAPLELPIRGSDKTVPEFMDNINLPRNPFQTIYYVGNLIREAVIDVSNEPFSLAPQFLTIARHSNIRVSILCGL